MGLSSDAHFHKRASILSKAYSGQLSVSFKHVAINFSLDKALKHHQSMRGKKEIPKQVTQKTCCRLAAMVTLYMVLIVSTD